MSQRDVQTSEFWENYNQQWSMHPSPNSQSLLDMTQRLTQRQIVGTEPKLCAKLYVKAHIDHALYISKLIRLDFMFI